MPEAQVSLQSPTAGGLGEIEGDADREDHQRPCVGQVQQRSEARSSEHQYRGRRRPGHDRGPTGATLDRSGLGEVAAPRRLCDEPRRYELQGGCDAHRHQHQRHNNGCVAELGGLQPSGEQCVQNSVG